MWRTILSNGFLGNEFFAAQFAYFLDGNVAAHNLYSFNL
ncbi:hypothetical protein BN938_1869 [Mucinivorans hirudinis]|uniref:Uncharacterized protein n=1 Tax=Mucinivorans hirudinis TaxID=1433126 RepID=A0A060RDM4_9BACT|nr:hypothetical protein BN938_1869 [Mucinivorans hirudinis]